VHYAFNVFFSKTCLPITSTVLTIFVEVKINFQTSSVGPRQLLNYINKYSCEDIGVSNSYCSVECTFHKM